jgi:hypothetical protein
MTTKQITPEALKMAWTMVQTIFPRYKIPAKERNALLTAISKIALDDLVSSGKLSWKKTLPAKAILVFEDQAVRMKAAEKSRLVLRSDSSPLELERAADWTESVFDKWSLTEEERATLYTALPCLGIEALRDYVTWNEEPPFVELG